MKKAQFTLFWSCLAIGVFSIFAATKSLANNALVFRGDSINKMNSLMAVPGGPIISLLEIQTACWGVGYSNDDYLVYDPSTRNCSLYDHSILVSQPGITAIEEALASAPFVSCDILTNIEGMANTQTVEDFVSTNAYIEFNFTDSSAAINAECFKWEIKAWKPYEVVIYLTDNDGDGFTIMFKTEDDPVSYSIPSGSLYLVKIGDDYFNSANPVKKTYQVSLQDLVNTFSLLGGRHAYNIHDPEARVRRISVYGESFSLYSTALADNTGCNNPSFEMNVLKNNWECVADFKNNGGSLSDTTQLQFGDSSLYVSAKPSTSQYSISINLTAGWNMISLPVEPEDKKIKTLFPDATAIFEFATEYKPLGLNSELEKGKGYWIYLPTAKTYSLTGLPLESYIISNVPNGWSIIGSCTHPALPLIDQGNLSVIFGFSNKYELLAPGDHLEPGKGYWVNLSGRTDVWIIGGNRSDPSTLSH